MRIVADANIPYVHDAFAPLGEVVTHTSAELTARAVRDADLLLVRSTVKVNGALLDGSRVRFVATATIGIDHLDLEYLGRAGIRWAAAPGSNADSVVQWLAAALLHAGLAGRVGPGATVGVVGIGNVGGRVARLCAALGARVLACDPPRQRAEGGDFVALDALLSASDLVTLHVPLTRDGDDATVRLMNGARLGHMRPGAWLVNASRGEVIDSAALVDALDRGRLAGALLDVFAAEPAPEPELVARARVATPHIAGHSLDGKANGTKMVYDAACDFLGVTPRWQPGPALPPPPAPEVALAGAGRSDVELGLAAWRAEYDVTADDAALRGFAALGPAERAVAFRRYRELYPVRRELGGRPVRLDAARPGLTAALAGLGIRVV